MTEIVFLIQSKVIFARTMIKSGFVILICFIYMAGSYVSFIPYLNYALNKDYISANLCENKSMPEMHCDGKCFIGKEIIKLNEQQQSSDKKEQQVQHNEIFPHELQSDTRLVFFETEVVMQNQKFLNSILPSFAGQIDMPPEFLS